MSGIPACLKLPACLFLQRSSRVARRTAKVQPGHISHDYSDHVSIRKFIDHNWYLSPLTDHIRDNLPNPKYCENKYAPTNIPAIGDLMDLFDLSRRNDSLNRL
jgi:hypothetical protein